MPRGKRKQAATPTEDTGPGHNNAHEPGLTDATVLTFAKRISDGRTEIKDITEERKTKVAEVRGIWKEAKQAGINNEALKRAIEDRDRSPDDVLAEEKSYLRYANLFRMPVTQIDLFGGVDDPDGQLESTEIREAAVDHAGRRGFDAGKQGVDASFCPYLPDAEESELHQAWMREWHRGQATLAEGMTRQ
jgi:ribosome modulation factor/uncharacterized protein (UPF0335 family)